MGWVTLSLVNAGLGWWLASLFLGPIATFLIVVLDSRVAVQSANRRPQRSTYPPLRTD